jgi:hypothetical protein
MRRILWRAAVLALLAAPAAAAAQDEPAPAAAGQAGEQAGAWEFLRQHRGELGITQDQQERLRAVAVRLTRTNGPLREQLRQERSRYLAQRRAELLRMTPEQRQAELARLRREGGRVPESMRPLLEQIRANQRAAMREAQGVLTPDQKQRARALFREWRRQRAARPGRGMGRGGLRPGRQRGGGVRPRGWMGPRGERP